MIRQELPVRSGADDNKPCPRAVVLAAVKDKPSGRPEAYPDRQIERQRVAIVHIGQHPERRMHAPLELHCKLLRLGDDGGDLRPNASNIVLRARQRFEADPAPRTPMSAIERDD